MAFENDEPRVVVFPIHWGPASWEVVRAEPIRVVDGLATTIARAGGRLIMTIPGYASNSVVVVAEIQSDVEALQRAIENSAEIQGRWITLADADLNVAPSADLDVQPHVVTLPAGSSFRDFLAAMPPQPYPCPECRVDLSRNDHSDDCSWKGQT